MDIELLLSSISERIGVVCSMLCWHVEVSSVNTGVETKPIIINIIRLRNNLRKFFLLKNSRSKVP
jgi:hypothetical protein